MLVAVILCPLCCHTRMPCRREGTAPQYTDAGTTCRCPIDVERPIGRHDCPFYNLESDTTENTFLDHPCAANSPLYDAAVVALSQKLGSTCTVSSDSQIQDMWRANVKSNSYTIDARGIFSIEHDFQI